MRDQSIYHRMLAAEQELKVVKAKLDEMEAKFERVYNVVAEETGDMYNRLNKLEPRVDRCALDPR
jgi:tetrahydromethanopterin S-methyltransferase subunit G